MRANTITVTRTSRTMVVVGIEMMMIVTWLGPTIEVVGVASVGVIWSLGGLVGEVVSGERERVYI